MKLLYIVTADTNKKNKDNFPQPKHLAGTFRCRG